MEQKVSETITFHQNQSEPVAPEEDTLVVELIINNPRRISLQKLLFQ
jgi:hypothetical protein